MIFNKNKNLIKKLKTLKSIRANNSFKISIRDNLMNEIGDVTNINTDRLHKQQNQSTVLQNIINIYQFNYKTMIPLILILTLLGGGAGATFASQNSLPGDILYPVKIASEKVETILVLNDVKDAKLHLDFATRRLNEINKLSEKGKVNVAVVDNAVKAYNNELVDVQDILNKTEKENSIQIATNLENKLTENKDILRALSKKIDNKDSLKELSIAWEKSIEHKNIANLILNKDETPIKSTENAIDNSTIVDTTTTDQNTQPEIVNKTQTTGTDVIKDTNKNNKRIIRGSDDTENDDNPFGDSENNEREIED